jgi:hypothetical protein
MGTKKSEKRALERARQRARELAKDPPVKRPPPPRPPIPPPPKANEPCPLSGWRSTAASSTPAVPGPTMSPSVTPPAASADPAPRPIPPWRRSPSSCEPPGAVAFPISEVASTVPAVASPISGVASTLPDWYGRWLGTMPLGTVSKACPSHQQRPTLRPGHQVQPIHPA